MVGKVGERGPGETVCLGEDGGVADAETKTEASSGATSEYEKKTRRQVVQSR